MDKQRHPSPEPLPLELRTIQQACHGHADDLLRSADTVLNQEKLPNIAYHLTTLALEEIGKAELVGISHAARAKGADPAVSSKHVEDHVKKLFWALWGPSFGKELITKDQIETFQGLAQNIHQTRLKGLYVSTEQDNFAPPKDAVSSAAAENLLSLTRARLGLARTVEPKEALTADEKADVTWFLTASSDMEKRNLIFGKKSMEKLVSLGRVDHWMRWLREEFEKADAQAREWLGQELKRQEPSEVEADQDKWRLKVRFFTNSHSIRAKDLAWWNSGVKWIKLHPVDQRKNELIVEFTLPKAVPVQGLWWAGWGGARRFACSINIGSMGFFWWYVPEQISRFYESIRDMENKSEVRVERNPVLKLDWRREVLGEQDLRNAGLAYAMLPSPKDRHLHAPFDAYLTGLGFLSKTDVHMQFEANAYEAFYGSLKAGMRQYGDWDGLTPFPKAFNTLLDAVLPGMDSQERTRYIDLGEQFAHRSGPITAITLSEVGGIKILCDAFFIRTFRQLAEERAQRETGGSKPPREPATSS